MYEDIRTILRGAGYGQKGQDDRTANLQDGLQAGQKRAAGAAGGFGETTREAAENRASSAHPDVQDRIDSARTAMGRTQKDAGDATAAKHSHANVPGCSDTKPGDIYSRFGGTRDDICSIIRAIKTAATLPQTIALQARKVNTEPTPAQREAGNFRKGHVYMHGLDISIEYPKGSIRSGTARDGKTWCRVMANHYGYIRKTVGNDEEHIDCFIGPNPKSELVTIINQVNPVTGKWDEHKVVFGALSHSEAKKIYRANYSSDWKGLGSAYTISMQQFKDWLKDGETTREFRLAKSESGTKAGAARDAKNTRVSSVALDERALSQYAEQAISSVRGQRNIRMQKMARIFPCLLQRHGPEAVRHDTRAQRQRQRIYARQLCVGQPCRTKQKQEKQSVSYVPTQDCGAGRLGKIGRNIGRDVAVKDIFMRLEYRAGINDAGKPSKTANECAADVQRRNESSVRMGAANGNIAPSHIQPDKIRLDGRRSAVDTCWSKTAEMWAAKLNTEVIITEPVGGVACLRGHTKEAGETINLMIGPHPEAELVFVGDRIDAATQKFAGYTLMLGFAKHADVKKMAQMQKLAAITPLTMDQLKFWLAEGERKKPVSAQTFSIKQAGSSDSDEKSEEDSDEPHVLIIRKRLTIRFIAPKRPKDKQKKDTDGIQGKKSG
jgi:hypothetical protein